MSTEVLEVLPLSPTWYNNVMRKVQTIFHRCIVSIGGMLDCTPSQQTFMVQPSRHHAQEPIPEHAACGVRRHQHRVVCGEAHGSRALAPVEDAGFDQGKRGGRGHGRQGQGEWAKGVGDDVLDIDQRVRANPRSNVPPDRPV